MPVPSSLADISTTAASNSPAGADAVGTSLDDYLRTIQAIVKRENSKGTDITASTTIDVPADGSYFVVTGNTTIAGISDDWNGRLVVLKFSGTPQLTHSSGFILPGSANITVAAGDCLSVVNESTGVWRVVVYQPAAGALSVSANNIWTGTQTFRDNKFELTDDGDTTKKIALQLSGITTGTTRTLTIGNYSGIPAVPVDEGTSGYVLTSAGAGSQPTWAASSSSSVPVRQTVLSGPVDSSGFSAFGGSTGSTTVTAAGTLKATAAAGGDANYTGSIVNPSWTGISTNGTMFLYLDITSGGVVTTGSTALEPTYQWGGTYSTTNLQNTFNIQEMTMKVGNGSTADQVYRVFVGEVTVAGSVVTAITWYALMGRYYAEQTGLATASQYVKNHNIGTKFVDHIGWLECTTANNNFSVGDRVPLASPGDKGSGAATAYYTGVKGSRMTIAAYTGSGGIGLSDYTTGACNVPFTASSWKIVFAPRRSF